MPGSALDAALTASNRRRPLRRPTRCRTPGPPAFSRPPGSSLGPLTFLGRDPGFSDPDFVVPNVHQFSAGIQRELPSRISLEIDLRGQPEL